MTIGYAKVSSADQNLDRQINDLEEFGCGQDKVIYDLIVDGLNNGTSVMDIHRKTSVSRSTIYSIRNTLTVKNELVL